MENKQFTVGLSVSFENKEEFERLTTEVSKKADELQEAIQRLNDFQAEFAIKQG